MATIMFFEETIVSQDGKVSMELEIGRSSFFDEDSLYIVVDGTSIVVNQKTAKRMIEAFVGVGNYLGLIER